MSRSGTTQFCPSDVNRLDLLSYIGLHDCNYLQINIQASTKVEILVLVVEFTRENE